MSLPRCAILAGRSILRLTGSDTRVFLQGLISNDITALTPDHALYAALLTPQGKYLFDFLLYATPSGILLDGERERLPALAQRLSMYRLRAKVAIENTDGELVVLAVFGGDALAILEADGHLLAHGAFRSAAFHQQAHHLGDAAQDLAGGEGPDLLGQAAEVHQRRSFSKNR